ncbi:hypothetical protein K493DRAFT_332729, partial [Basidiobolus meristosporus CBS 931.73]
MSTESDRESLRRRREARQRRILASGEDRLNRIKASFTDSSGASPVTAPNPVLSEPESPKHRSTSAIKESSLTDESPQIFSTPPIAPKSTTETTGAEITPDIRTTPSSSEFSTPSLAPRALPVREPSPSEDPLFALRQEWQSILTQNASGSSTPNADAMPFNLESLLSGQAPLASLLSQQAATSPAQNSTPSWWFALRITAVGVLVMFVFYMEWLGAGMSKSMLSDRFEHLKDRSPDEIYGEGRLGQMPVFWYFLTAEVGLQAIRLFFNKGAQPASIPVPLQLHGGLIHRSVNLMYQYKTI